MVPPWPRPGPPGDIYPTVLELLVVDCIMSVCYVRAVLGTPGYRDGIQWFYGPSHFDNDAMHAVNMIT